MKKNGHWPRVLSPVEKSLGIGHYKKGFTLAEMLIVLIIIAVLTAFGGRMYFSERDRFIYNNSLTQILQIINTARNSATTSRGVYVNGQNVVPPSGYGVYINLQPNAGEPHFTLFASLGDGTDGDPSTLNNIFDNGIKTGNDTIADQILQTLRLPDQVHFQFLEFKNGNVPNQTWDKKYKIENSVPVPKATEAVIFFRPPLAETYLAGGMPGAYEDLEDLGLRFYNSSAPEISPKRCQYVTINRVKTFPSIDYDNCISSSPDYPL